MFKNILLPYDFENDLAISVKYYNKHKKDIIREKEKNSLHFYVN